jgi:hypothetical protein
LEDAFGFVGGAPGALFRLREPFLLIPTRKPFQSLRKTYDLAKKTLEALAMLTDGEEITDDLDDRLPKFFCHQIAQRKFVSRQASQVLG